MRLFFVCLITSLSIACTPKAEEKTRLDPDGVSLIVLGTMQDAGSPQIGCTKDCCKDLFDNPDQTRRVVSLGVVDNANQKKYLFEATPDITAQMKDLARPDVANPNQLVDGIFLTHAHIGHYTGLMYLGKEATNASQVPVYAMPRMKAFLESNGPWSQLVETGNIAPQALSDNEPVQLTPQLRVTPLQVPHRDEFSETVGYRIEGPNKSALFIPDIDKWSKWERSIVEEIARVDYAFLDATFYSGEEIGNRDITQIPHPFIIESLELFKDLEPQEKAKVIFIHFNHTNPVAHGESEEAQRVGELGFGVARYGAVYEL
ncbi:MBL fold metallo-hydrolase [Cryomorphaceae bacterium]|nr:MBL fold metallo-hydrolase [Cryomorphaceae bacterium]